MNTGVGGGSGKGDACGAEVGAAVSVELCVSASPPQDTGTCECRQVLELILVIHRNMGIEMGNASRQ